MWGEVAPLSQAICSRHSKCFKADIQCVLNGHSQVPLEKKSQAKLGLYQMASSYTPVYPIACHFYLSEVKVVVYP